MGMLIYDRDTRQWVPWELTYNFDRVYREVLNADRYERMRREMKED